MDIDLYILTIASSEVKEVIEVKEVKAISLLANLFLNIL